MTPEALAEIEARANAATEGRWTVEGLRVLRGTAVVCTLPLDYSGPAPANARFIAAARTDIPALCTALRAAWGDLAQLGAEQQDAHEELARTARAIYGQDTDAHMLHEAAAEVVADRDAARAEAAELRTQAAERERAFAAALDVVYRKHDEETDRLRADLLDRPGTYTPARGAEAEDLWWELGAIMDTLKRVSARDSLPGLIERDDARAEADRLRAELAEALATLANERGEGEPPCPGWEFRIPDLTGWRTQDDSEHRRWCNGDLLVYRDDRNTWGFARGCVRVAGFYPTARAAMRAATAAEGAR